MDIYDRAIKAFFDNHMSINVYGPYFKPEEFGITNDTDQQVRKNLYLLTKFALNPIRKKFGPVSITSGYRSPDHNLMVGGVDGSQHTTGEAVDLTCSALPSNRPVYDWLATWWPGQCFYYLKKGHIHIALPRIDLQVAGRLYCSVQDK